MTKLRTMSFDFPIQPMAYLPPSSSDESRPRRPARAKALKALFIGAAACLASCSQMQPYQRPEVPLPAQWASDAAPAAAPASTPVAWRDFIADPTLRALVDQALRNNRDVRVAALQAEQLRAQYRVRESVLWPTVGTAIGAGRQNLDSSKATYSAALQISNWEIDLFGRLASLEEAAVAQYLTSQEVAKSVQISLVAAVSTAWLNLQTTESLLALTQQTLRNREESLRLVRLRFDHGTASALELRNAESVMESARVILAQQTRQRALDLNYLMLLMGRPLDRPLTAAELASGQDLSLPASQILNDVPVGLPSQVLLERPDIVAAEQRLIAANAQIGVARAAFFPRISLTASVGSSSPDLSQLFSAGTWGWTFIPQAPFTLFSGGANQANLDIAKAGREIAVAQYERAIQTSFREVNDALVGRDTLGQQHEAQARLVQAESERLRLSELRLSQGVANQLEVLDAQRSLFSAEQSLVQSRFAMLQNRVALFKVLGGI